VGFAQVLAADDAAGCWFGTGLGQGEPFCSECGSLDTRLRMTHRRCDCARQAAFSPGMSRNNPYRHVTSFARSHCIRDADQVLMAATRMAGELLHQFGQIVNELDTGALA